MYFILPYYDNSVKEVQVACRTILNLADLETRVLSYIRLLYQLDRIQESGWTHCEITPAAIFAEASNPGVYHIGAFGRATKGECSTVNTEFTPPDHFIPPFIPEDHVNAEELKQQLQKKFDLFSLGMVFASMELEFEDWQALRHLYFDFAKSSFEKLSSPETSAAWKEVFGNAAANASQKRFPPENEETLPIMLLQAKLIQLIAHIATLDPSARFNTQFYLFQTHELYNAVLSEKENIKMRAEGKSEAELINHRLEDINEIKLRDLPNYELYYKDEIWLRRLKNDLGIDVASKKIRV